MVAIVDFAESNDFGRHEPYRGEVPSAVGRLIVVVRAGQYKNESWVLCEDSKVDAVKAKYGKGFVRVAGRMLIDRKPVRVALMTNYSKQISELDEDLLLSGAVVNNESGEARQPGTIQGDTRQSETESKDYNPLLDLPRLAKAIATLTTTERKLFNLWIDRTQPKNHEKALGVASQTVKLYRIHVRKKLSVAFGARSSDDFEKRLLAIGPVLKKYLVQIESHGTQSVA